LETEMFSQEEKRERERFRRETIGCHACWQLHGNQTTDFVILLTESRDSSIIRNDRHERVARAPVR